MNTAQMEVSWMEVIYMALAPFLPGLTLARDRQPPLAYYLSLNPILSQVTHRYWVNTGCVNWYSEPKNRLWPKVIWT